MKKVMFAAAVAAGLAAFGTGLESANTVGYETKQAASAGTMMLGAIQFDGIGTGTMDVSKAVIPSVAPAAYDENNDYAYDANWYKSAAQIQIRVGNGWTVLYYTSCGADQNGDPAAGWALPEDGAIVTMGLTSGTGVWLTSPSGANCSFTIAGEVKSVDSPVATAQSSMKLVSAPYPVSFGINDATKVTWDVSSPAAYDENNDYAYDANWYKNAAQIQKRVGNGWTVLYYTSCGADQNGDPAAGWALPEDAAIVDLTIGTCEGFWLTDPNGFSFTVKNPVAHAND